MLSGLTDLNQLPAAQWCVSKVLIVAWKDCGLMGFNYLGEKVVRENEYLSAMLSDAINCFGVGIASLCVLFFDINLAIMRLFVVVAR